MKVSIIVPIFNAENYLARCLDSIIKSSELFNGECELILVDNGSTDGSIKIMAKYHKDYPKLITLKECKARGAGAARNYGFRKASGQYVWFIDADDTIRKDALSKLMDKAKETSADLVMLGMQRVYPNGHTDYLSAVCPKQNNYKSRFIRYGLGPVQVLIKREWWQKKNFQFREGVIHEDMELMSALILYTEKFACVDEPLYNYYQNAESVLHKSKWDPHCFDIFSALEGLFDRFKANNTAEKYHDELEWFFIWNLLIDSAKDFDKFKEGKSGFKRARGLLKKYYPNWRKNRFLKQKPLKLRLLVRLNYSK